MTEKNSGIGKKLIVGCIIVLFLLTAVVYAYGVHYFTGHFLPGSHVNGFNCAYMTVGEAENLLREKVGAYVLAVDTMKNGREAISAEEVGLEPTEEVTASLIRLVKNQSRFTWFLSFNRENAYDVADSLRYDEEKFQTAVNGMKCMQPENVTPFSDAQIRDNGEKFEIIPEVVGNALDPKKTAEVISMAMLTGESSVSLEEESCYLKPAVYQDDEQLIRNCEQMNQYAQVIITYDFADRTERVDRAVLSDWFTVDQNGDAILSEKKVGAYVAQLAEKYDTVGLTRTFLTYDNREKVIAGGDYGWVIDQEAETKALIEAIESGVTQVREPVYSHRGWSRGTNDIGATYVEIDLSNQRLVFYKNGIPTVDSPVVTGNAAVAGCATPVGCFGLDAKESPAVLTGEDYQANVTYWMPFSGNVGIHDASWRSDFGGGLYLWEGSHGCVNMPYDQAAALYGNVEVNMPVVIYE